MKDNESPIAPESWERRNSASDTDTDHDDSASECSSSSQSVPLLRHSSLAELSSIATACSFLANNAKLDSETCDRTFDPVNFSYRHSTLAVADQDLKSKTASNEHVCRSSTTFAARIPATPPKQGKSEDPLTPTANLKMLVSAASPAIRDREIKKRELFARPDGEFCLPYMDAKPSFSENVSDKTTVSRKDKSLGLLCQRFLSNYPETPPVDEHIEIGLDEVAKNLNVERRRIYDIVNVLESVEVISRYAKNRYVWHGKTRLPDTLARLKASAVAQGFSCKRVATGKENPDFKGQVRKLNSGSQLPRLLPKDPNVIPGSAGQLSSNQGQEILMEEEDSSKKFRDEYCRKDKSLGVLSQKFLMMFLVSETKQVTLEDAANVLIDDAEEGHAKFKTKVRRLYDIANILSSLQLIEKVHIHSLQSGRKPGFRWIGMDLDKLNSEQERLSGSSNVNRKTSALGQTLLPETRWIKQEPLSAVGRLISRRPSQQQLRQSNRMDGNVKCKMPRSRSDRTLMYKKRAHTSNSRDSEEDGYSVHELGGVYDDVTIGSPTEVKFRSELKKLQEQYPDRMSQLLSACHQGLPETLDSKKSRRTLFSSVDSESASCENTGPKAKRPKRSSDEDNAVKSFVHSTASAFRPLDQGVNDPGAAAVCGGVQHSPDIGKAVSDRAKNNVSADANSQSNSPEQKIYLERQKQKELLREQSSFDSSHLQDERWKRIERELEKAFANCHPNTNVSKKYPSFVNQSSSPIPNAQLIEQSSVGIQASLIDTVSPLKPLSYVRKNSGSPWQSTAPVMDQSQPPTVSVKFIAPPQQATVAAKSVQGMQVTHSVSPPAAQISPRHSPVGNAVLLSNGSQAPLILPMPAKGPGVVWNPQPSQSTPAQKAVILNAPMYSFSSPALNSPTSLLPVSTIATSQSAPVEKSNSRYPSVTSTIQCSMPALQPKPIAMVTQLTPAMKSSTANPVTASADTPSNAGVLLSEISRRLSMPLQVQVTSISN